jgi:8-oxo-dGTP pyrophosphatase MutT (NUDIX family)
MADGAEAKAKKGVEYVGVTLSFFCHDGKGNFVLTKRSANCRDEQGRWDFGGGGLELHDSVEGRLKEEIREELCTDVLSYEFLGYRDLHRDNAGVPTHWIALDFKVLVDRAKVANGEPHKFDEIGWFTLDALPSPLHSQAPNELALYRDKLLAS